MPDRSPENLSELLDAQLTRGPEKVFLIRQTDGSTLTYRQFDEAVNRAAAILASLGARPGDRVSLLLTNRAEYLILYFACFKIGAWAGPVNALLKPQEVEFIVANSEAQTAVTQPDLLPHLEAAREHVPSLRNVIVVEESGQWLVVSGQREESGPWSVASGQPE